MDIDELLSSRTGRAVIAILKSSLIHFAVCFGLFAFLSGRSLILVFDGRSPETPFENAAAIAFAVLCYPAIYVIENFDQAVQFVGFWTPYIANSFVWGTFLYLLWLALRRATRLRSNLKRR
jgi:hypothetical protein